MRKTFYLIMLLLVTAIISGCSGDESDSDSKSLALPDETGKDIQFENMDQPALVFFFTGVG
ncbi:hypothetical protein [Mesobacillus subterraneus]|uniref:Redoxin domain-containing protein n=1 Tax=Mesobacillus subterraneus TaxID=285983 RepID=A0A427TX42_9BACI|nr:hypothetical protein [Mesobacillus subterraneus]RSD29043.1 hypothetical protein EJA10_02735 [Mesobacillus subterraneus]